MPHNNFYFKKSDYYFKLIAINKEHYDKLGLL